MNNVYVPGTGPHHPKIVLLGESPSYQEVRELTPFVGPSGKFLNHLLREAGINRDECWLTNVVKYFVRPSTKEKSIPFATRCKLEGIDLEKQVDELLTELAQLKPNVVIAFGRTALWALTGKTDISDYRGSIMEGRGFKVIPTYHPAHILYQEGEVKGYYNRFIVALDLKRAKAESVKRDLDLPSRNLAVINSSYELACRFDRYPKLVACDTEQRDQVTRWIGFAPNAHEGIALELFSESIPVSEAVNMWNLTSRFLSQAHIIGQNFGYDRNKIRPLGFTIGKLHDDTMLKAFCVNPELPVSQGFLASIYTREPFYKNENMYEGSLKDLGIGCARDCAVSYEINTGLQKDIDEMGLDIYYRDFVLQLHHLYFFREDWSAIEQVGFRVNEQIRAEIIRKYIERDEKIRLDLFQLTGEYVNCSSPKQVSTLLYDKFKLPMRAGTGEEVLTALLSNHVKNPVHAQVISLILEERQVKKTLGSYAYAAPDFDGRMRTSYFLCLETGRSASQKQEPPIREKLEYRDEENKLKRADLGLAFQTITKHGDIGPDIRRILVPDDGCVFVQADGEQAEARVIFLLANDFEALKLIDEIDYHALTTTWFFGGKYEDYAKPILGYEKPERFVGKTLRHAGHLGASKKRAALTVNTDARKFKIPISISEYKAGEALEEFHRRQPNIKGVFQADVIKQIDKNRRLIAPVPYGINTKVGGTRIFFERSGEELYREAFSYIPQRTVSEMTKGAAMRARARMPEIKFIVEAHDGLLYQIPEHLRDDSARILREEMMRPIDFSTCSLERGMLVIPCSLEYGYDYKDMKKLKV